jgi:arsenite methyltransferase
MEGLAATDAGKEKVVPMTTPAHSIRCRLTAAGLAALLGLGLLWARPAPAQQGHPHERMPNVMEYLDRLDRPERDQEQKPAQVVDALGLKPGMRVADLGAGSGYFTRRFVEAVTETGKVYVIDVEPEALKYVEESLVRMHRPYEAEFIVARPDNPKIPFESVDIIFVCNTYHHLEDRTVYFRNTKSSLKLGGRIAIVDYYHDDRSGELGFPKRHLVARDTVVEEMTGAGYRLVKEHTFLPKQYFLEFAPQ